MIRRAFFLCYAAASIHSWSMFDPGPSSATAHEAGPVCDFVVSKPAASSEVTMARRH